MAAISPSGLFLARGFCLDHASVYDALGSPDADSLKWTGLKLDNRSTKTYVVCVCVCVYRLSSWVQFVHVRTCAHLYTSQHTKVHPHIKFSPLHRIHLWKRYCGTVEGLRMRKNRYARVWGRRQPERMPLLSGCAALSMARAKAVDLIRRLPGAEKCELLTEQLIRYTADDLFFNLHW